MVSVSQAVQSLNAAGAAPSVPLARTALIAASLPPAPSVVVSLGNALPEPVLYTASGLLAPAFSSESGPSAANDNTTVEPTSGTRRFPASVATAAPASTTALPAIPAAAESVAALMPINVFIDPAVKSLADFTTNPVHGNLATALNVNAAIYRAKQLSSASLVSAIDVPGPVTLLNSINVDITDLKQQSSGNQRRRTVRP